MDNGSGKLEIRGLYIHIVLFKELAVFIPVIQLNSEIWRTCIYSNLKAQTMAAPQCYHMGDTWNCLGRAAAPSADLLHACQLPTWISSPRAISTHALLPPECLVEVAWHGGAEIADVEPVSDGIHEVTLSEKCSIYFFIASVYKNTVAKWHVQVLMQVHWRPPALQFPIQVTNITLP